MSLLRRYWLTGLPVVVGALFAFVQSFQSHADLTKVQNADLLYLPMLLRDLVEGGALRDWILTPSPYLFPDLLVQVPLSVFALSPHVATGVVMLMQPLAGLVVAVGLFSKAGVRGAGWFGNLLGLLVLAYALRASDTVLPFLVLSYHAGQAILGLGCLWLALTNTRAATWALVVLTLFGSLSDPIFVLGWVAACAIILVGTRPRWTGLVLSGVVAGASGLGLMLRRLLPLPPQLGGIVNLDRARSTWSLYLTSLPSAASAVMIVAWCLAVFALFVHWRDRRARLLVLALIAVALGTLVGLAAVGLPTRLPDSRYLTSHTLALLALVSLALGATTRPGLTGMIGVLVVAFSADRGVSAAATARFDLQPGPLACVSQLRPRLSRCVAGYWASKPILLLADPPLVAMQVKADGTPDWFISSRRHFQVREEIDCAVFPDGDAPIFASIYGPGVAQQRCDGFTVFVYEGEAKRQLNAALRPRLDQPAVPSPFF